MTRAAALLDKKLVHRLTLSASTATPVPRVGRSFRLHQRYKVLGRDYVAFGAGDLGAIPDEKVSLSWCQAITSS